MSVKDKVEAIDRFVRTIKESGVYDDVQAACIMAGWTNLAGALTPFKGAAPTNGGGLFQNADLDPGIGLKGDGSSKYLNSNWAATAAPQDDTHGSVFVSSKPTSYGKIYFGNSNGNTYGAFPSNANTMQLAANHLSGTVNVSATGIGDSISLVAVSRSSSSSVSYIAGTHAGAAASVSASPLSEPLGVFARSTGAFPTDATLSWYSIGSATDLAALDSAVSTLMADLRAIDEQGFDRDALAYIRAVEAADGGSFLETGVKKAINRFIVGLKKDNLWDAIKASCILCGARTIAGALVPLAGTAPTAYGGWASGDYNRETGLVGNGTTKYLDSNRANDADGQDDAHQSVFITQNPTIASGITGAIQRSPSLVVTELYCNDTSATLSGYLNSVGAVSAGVSVAPTFFGVSRTASNALQARLNGTDTLRTTAASYAPTAYTVYIFGRNDPQPTGSLFPTNARLAFYSVGSAIDLALLDSRVSTLVSEIAAAIP